MGLSNAETFIGLAISCFVMNLLSICSLIVSYLKLFIDFSFFFSLVSCLIFGLRGLISRGVLIVAGDLKPGVIS